MRPIRATLIVVSMIFLPLIADGLPQHGTVLWNNLVKPTSEFHQDQLETLFREILSKAAANTSVIHVEVMDDPESYVLTAMWRDELNYEVWRNMFSDYEKRIPPMAEILAIGKNAAMRIRDEQGNVSTKVLQGSDPYVFHACGEDLSLIHLGMHEPLRPPNYEKSYVSLHFFFVVTVQPDEKLTRCVVKEVRRLSNISDVNVNIRTDPWFIDESLFPVISPFLSEIRPPSKDEYESAPQWHCGVAYDGKVSCWGHGRLPFSAKPTGDPQPLKASVQVIHQEFCQQPQGYTFHQSLRVHVVNQTSEKLIVERSTVYEPYVARDMESLSKGLYQYHAGFEWTVEHSQDPQSKAPGPEFAILAPGDSYEIELEFGVSGGRPDISPAQGWLPPGDHVLQLMISTWDFDAKPEEFRIPWKSFGRLVYKPISTDPISFNLPPDPKLDKCK